MRVQAVGASGSWKARLVRGAVAGAVATIPMTVVMVAARRAGFMRAAQPPMEITDRATDAVGDHSRPSRATVGLAHLGFGVVAGAGYAVAVERLVLNRPITRLGAGVAFGLAVWSVSYAGVLPAIELMPRPDDDAPGRPATMITAHVVFGAALAATLEALSPRRAR